jgi:hypothetical protein
MSTIYEINGKTADLTRAVPLTLGDYEDLEGKGLNLHDMGNMSFKQMRVLVVHILQKVNKEITDDDARSLSMDQTVALQKTFNALLNKEKPNVPT